VSPRVLLVDDAEDVRAIATISLERVGGWTVVAVPSGQAALDVLARPPEFDAVLLDVMMPGMDGPATLREIRRSGVADGLTAVFLTAKTDAAELNRLRSLGAAGVIAKPFDPMRLADELERILASRDGTSPPARRLPGAR
jgi:two-component system OmpR family response regulator